MKNEMDLRVRKTRKNIRSAFITLLKEKSLADISVTELCRIAQCNRNTFYRYYPNKEAVLEELTEICVSEITRGTRAIVHEVEQIDSDIIFSYIENIVNSAFKARELMSLLLQYGYHDLSLILTDAVYQNLMENTVALAPRKEENVKVRFFCRYIAGGIVSFIIYWTQASQLGRNDAIRLLQNIHGPVIQHFMETIREAP